METDENVENMSVIRVIRSHLSGLPAFGHKKQCFRIKTVNMYDDKEVRHHINCVT